MKWAMEGQFTVINWVKSNLRILTLLLPAMAFVFLSIEHQKRPLPEFFKHPELLLLAWMNGGVIEYCGREDDPSGLHNICEFCNVCAATGVPEIMLEAQLFVFAKLRYARLDQVDRYFALDAVPLARGPPNHTLT